MFRKTINSWKGLTWFAQALIILALVAVGYFVANFAGLLPEAVSVGSLVPTKAELPEFDHTPQGATNPNFTQDPIPNDQPARLTGPQVRIAGWAWSSQMGFWYAMGDTTPREGSLMAKHGANVRWHRTDYVDQMQNELVECATQLSRGASECTTGATHVSIMWDGAPAFVSGVNPVLAKLGKEYTLEYVGSCGFSRGEDKFMGLPEWREDPQTARGALIAGVLRDGDWNIALKWAGDNNIPNNPDETTYDPDALNWLNTPGYIEASQQYIAGVCETRPVVRNGERTGETARVCVNGVVTWTPGDVMVAEEKGGLVTVVSTEEYSSQMPNALLGIKKFGSDNPATIDGMLAAIFEGGENIRYNPAKALPYAAQVSAKAYQEKDAAYWMRYYYPVTETDIKGLSVRLGGSYANTLADNLRLFGLEPGSANVAEAVYRTFGDILVQQYPSLVPEVWPVEDIINTSYIERVAQRMEVTEPAEVEAFSPSGRVGKVVSEKPWQINFQTGSAEFTPEAEATLQKLLDSVVFTGLAIEVHGHTDGLGDAESNMALSERRAFAVKQWLESKAPANFPTGRIKVFYFGETSPVAPNDTEAGRAQNRRVDVILRKVN